MTTLWIDNNLVIRWHPNWPKEDEYLVKNSVVYREDLAQAKAESVPVITNYAGEMMDRIGNSEFKPDSFIELAGEVIVGWQHKVIIGGGWVDCSEEHYNSQHESFPHIFRKVARLKPASSAMSFAEGHEIKPALIGIGPVEHEYQCHFNLRARILEEFNKDIYHRGVFRTQDIVDAAMESLDKVLDKLNVK